MSCQCYRIDGPFIDADPDCPVHGRKAQSRERWADALLEEAQAATSVERLREIVQEMYDLITDL